MAVDWYTIKQIKDDIFAIDDHGQDWIYLILGSERALLLDTGWGLGNLKNLVSSLTKLPLIVVNTHGHPDHVGGDFQFSDIHISNDDLPSFQNCFSIEARSWALKNVLQDAFPEGFDPEQWIHAKPHKMIDIPNGHCFDLGNKTIEAIALPGHSPGSTAFLAREDRLLFSGDSVHGGHIWMHLEHSTSLRTFQSGLINLLSYQELFDDIYPSHLERVQSDVIYDLINGLEDIIQGRKKGRPYRTFAGNGLMCQLGKSSIIYRETKQ